MTNEQVGQVERRSHPRIAVVGVALPAASVICTQLLLMMTCIAVAVNVVSFVQPSSLEVTSSSPEYWLVGISAIGFGLCIYSAPLVALIGLILSVVGYRRPDAERTMPVLGIIANGALLIFSCGILSLSLLLTMRDIIDFINSRPNF